MLNLFLETWLSVLSFAFVAVGYLLVWERVHAYTEKNSPSINLLFNFFMVITSLSVIIAVIRWIWFT